MCRFIQYIVLYASFCAPYMQWYDLNNLEWIVGLFLNGSTILKIEWLVGLLFAFFLSIM